MSYALVKAGGHGQSLYYLPARRAPFIFPPAWRIPPGAIVLPRSMQILGGQNVRFATLPPAATILVAIPTATPARLWWREPLTPRQCALVDQADVHEREEVRALLTKEQRFTFPETGQRTQAAHDRSLARLRAARATAAGLHPAEMYQTANQALLGKDDEAEPVPIPRADHPSWRARLFGALHH